VLPKAMKPAVECRKLAALFREKAKAMPAGLKGEYDYLVRGFSRLARQFEQDGGPGKGPDKLPRRRIRKKGN